MNIETNRILMRRLQDSDAPDFFKTVGDPEVMKYWRGTDKNEDEILNRIQGKE